MEPWMKHEADEMVASHGTVPPPWAVYDYHPYSMGWRMGGGEGFMLMWWAWWPLQEFTQERMIEYFRQWPPPPCWLPHVIAAIWDIDTFERRDELPPFFERLAAWGFGTQWDYQRDLEDPKWHQR